MHDFLYEIYYLFMWNIYGLEAKKKSRKRKIITTVWWMKVTRKI